MKKICCLSLLPLLLALQLCAQVCDTVPFINTYWVKGLPQYNIQKIIDGNNGQAWLFGNCLLYANTINQAQEIFVTKINPRGVALKTAALGIRGDVSVSTVTQMPQGDFLLVGGLGNDQVGDALLIRLDSNFNTLWSYGLGKPTSTFSAVVATADGGCAVTGTYTAYNGGNAQAQRTHAVVLKFDAKGALQWGKEMYAPLEQDGGDNIVQAPDGNLVFCGVTNIHTSTWANRVVEKLDINTGNEIWGEVVDSVLSDVAVFGNKLILQGGTYGINTNDYNTVYWVDGQSGTISSGEYFYNPAQGFSQGFDYGGLFADGGGLYTANVNSRQVALVKTKKDFTGVDWAEILPGATSYGAAHIEQSSRATGYVSSSGVYVFAPLTTSRLSVDTVTNEYNAYLARTNLNGRSACADTLIPPFIFTPIPPPVSTAFVWPTVNDIVSDDTVLLSGPHLLVNNGIDCYQTACCRDTTVFDTITFCKGGSYMLPDSTVVTNGGLYSVDLKRISGCDSVVNITVNVTQPTRPNLGDDTCFVDKNPVVLQASAPYAQSYLWQDGSMDSIFKASVPGVYWVQAKNVCGIATDSIVIYPSCSLPVYVPSAFTPNGDGHNDIFRILDMKGQRLLDFSVYNRWGQCIFRTANPQQGWDGTLNGQLSPPATFVYIVQYVTVDGKNKYLKGSVVLIR